MGVRLLQRVADGYELTIAGEAIRPYAERMEGDAASLELEVAGKDTRLEGVVRITSLQMVASHLLASCFAQLHHMHPRIVLELTPNMPSTALSAHDVDISVRLTAFEQHELVVRSLGYMGFGLYATKTYLDRYGIPDTRAGCMGHRLITFINPHLPEQAAWVANHAADAATVMKTDNYEMQHWSVVEGGGIALLPRFRGDPDDTLQRINTHVPIPGAEISLGVHRENRHTPRVRTVLDCIFETVRGRKAELDPPADPLEEVLDPDRD